MMKKWNVKIIAMVLVIATLISVVPLNVFAAEEQAVGNPFQCSC